MKIRNGFVSNSSSSSFIIMVDGEAKKCPTCGHTPASIVDMIDKSKCCGYYEDTSIESMEEYVRSTLHYSRNDLVSEIKALEMRDPNEQEYPNSMYHEDYTVSQALARSRQELVELDNEIAKYHQLSDEGKKLYHLQISYHDELVQHILNDNVTTGIVTILEEL